MLIIKKQPARGNRLKLSAATLRYLVTFSATKTTLLHDGVLNEAIYTTPVCSKTANNLEVFRYLSPWGTECVLSKQVDRSFY